MAQQTATWTVRGANWVWKSSAPIDKSPMEIATRALESFWHKNVHDLWDPDEAWKGTPKFDLHLAKGESASLGICLRVEHDKMENRQDQKILVCAVTALANAGFHHDAKRLRDTWEDNQKKET